MLKPCLSHIRATLPTSSLAPIPCPGCRTLSKTLALFRPGTFLHPWLNLGTSPCREPHQNLTRNLCSSFAVTAPEPRTNLGPTTAKTLSKTLVVFQARNLVETLHKVGVETLSIPCPYSGRHPYLNHTCHPWVNLGCFHPLKISGQTKGRRHLASTLTPVTDIVSCGLAVAGSGIAGGLSCAALLTTSSSCGFIRDNALCARCRQAQEQ